MRHFKPPSGGAVVPSWSHGIDAAQEKSSYVPNESYLYFISRYPHYCNSLSFLSTQDIQIKNRSKAACQLGIEAKLLVFQPTA